MEQRLEAEYKEYQEALDSIPDDPSRLDDMLKELKATFFKSKLDYHFRIS